MKRRQIISILVIAISVVGVIFIILVANSDHEIASHKFEDVRPDFNPVPAYIIESPATPAAPTNPPPPVAITAPVSRVKADTPSLRHAVAPIQTAEQAHDWRRRNGKLRVAFAITMTSDGTGLFHDGAAVLAYTILKTIHTDVATSALFDSIGLVAFVHPDVSPRNRQVLTQIGYHVIEADTPVNVPAIRGDFLREKINKNGCCGAAELIKLSSYLLLGYDLVLHLDADTYFTGASLRELFGSLIYRDGVPGGPESLHSLVYTTDPNMASHKGEGKMPVQGGFIVFRPSLEDYDRVVDIVMNTEFVQGGAWNRSKIGWFWGGMTIQGVLPYYYNAVSTPGRTLIIDRCKYNTMADTVDCTDTAGGTRNTLQSGQVVSAHFTVCQKPWGCHMRYWSNRPKEFNGPLCFALHQQWFQLRQETEAFYGLDVNDNACSGRYAQMDFNKLLDAVDKSVGSRDRPPKSPSLAPALVFGGRPYDSKFRWDRSPDVFHPRPVSKYPNIIKDVYT